MNVPGLPGPVHVGGAAVPPNYSSRAAGGLPPIVSTARRTGSGMPDGFLRGGDAPMHGIEGVGDTMVTASNIYSAMDPVEDLVLAPVFTLGKSLTNNELWSLPRLNSKLIEVAQQQLYAPRKMSSGRQCASSADDVFTDLDKFLRQFSFSGFSKGLNHKNNGAPIANRAGWDKNTVTTIYRGLIHNVPMIWGPHAEAGDEVCIALKYVTHGATKNLKKWDGEVIADHSNGFQTLQLVPMVVRDGVPIGISDGSEQDFSSTRYVTVKVPGYDGQDDYEFTCAETVPSMVYSVGKLKDIKGVPFSETETHNAVTTCAGWRHLRTHGPTCDLVMNTRGKRAKFLSIS